MKTGCRWFVGFAVAGVLTFALAVPSALADSRAKLESDAKAALSALYKKYPESRKLGDKAKAILIFPNVIKAGLMIGGETGDGVMLVKGKTTAFYNTSGVSYGLQVGAQKYGYGLFIMSDAGLKALDAAEGFEVGVGPSIVLVDEGMAKKTTSTTIDKDIYAFIFSQKGLMAGLGIQGNKISRLKK